MNKNKVILLIMSAVLIVGGSGIYTYNSFAKPANTDIVDETVSEEEEAVEVIPNTKSISEVLAETKKLQSMQNTEILYISDKNIIVNTDVSLLVFDFEKNKIVRALDSADFRRKNNLSYGGTSFKVSKDGEEIYIVSDKENDESDIYCYNLKDDNTTKIKSLSDKEIYDGRCKKDEIDYSKDDYINNTTGAFRNKKLLDHKHMEDGNVGYLFYDEALNPDSNLFEMLVLTINTSNKNLELYGIDYK